MKSKSQELEILDGAIKALGTHTYLGPWLAEVRGEVENLIRSDFFVCLTIKHNQDKAAQIVADAKAQADQIIAQAQMKADKMEKMAEKYRDSVADAIRQASAALYR